MTTQLFKLTLASLALCAISCAVQAETVEEHLQQGKALSDQAYKQGNDSVYKSAEQEFREAVRLEPMNADARIYLGNNLANQRRFEEAESHLREAVRLRPDLQRTHGFLGTVLAQREKWKEAEAELRTALSLPSAGGPTAYFRKVLQDLQASTR